MNKHLLPINSTELEKKLALINQQALTFDAFSNEYRADIIRQIHDPDLCPAYLLPYLAWATSVDYWQEDWDEQTKRNVIKAAWLVHKIKGTRTAVKQMIAAFGYAATLKEWFNIGGTPGTFEINVDVFGLGISQEIEQVIYNLVRLTKPVSRHISKLRVMLTTRLTQHYSLAAISGETTTILPYIPSKIITTCNQAFACALQSLDSTTIYPETV